jgi:hypothetical protein
MANLSIEAKHKLREFITGGIEFHQLDDHIKSELEKAGFVKPAFAYTPAEFIEQQRPYIEQWFKRDRV